MNQDRISAIVDLLESERASLGIPDVDPTLTSDGFAMWEEDDLPSELPTNAWGLVSQSSATGIGLGRVKTAFAYRRPNGTYLTVALEASDEGRCMYVAGALDVREANAQLLIVMEGWAFCGWEISCRLAGADDSPQIAADGAAPISLADRRARHDLAA